ncbi:hypothetical protein NGUA41_02150 [Salmonella enterica]|nr:hypothetical protein NGUA40_04596 [Salmonella enterica]GAS77291.1 hypothetical protein NGUA41_02150 [Salmonella enterica]
MFPSNIIFFTMFTFVNSANAPVLVLYHNDLMLYKLTHH